ncbi:hypothetical protein TTHERM_00418500 (macronuclear) [Tetrahymena thermophila SB210]|uniref:Uncharacterized protein n=1 Tax=Tetrahymena thermophila (strain SB210) TaxID=312017 RepID=Q22NV1_TETTS|nr:hypothetical protein TTHERM_00418500 [Tetrahymena thermophila SB210]EAR87060.2 hypothetical protein TTHERM_00418500 [Tetrahymena thermophila SB210]|eukprot:XP_001007305.2 hypothetical protein TTHERM_00418500 [Tetrahymena thermophila SB210]
MSAQKGKSQENSQRVSSIQRSNSNSNGKPHNNSSKVVEERKNEIKRKLLEQMQSDLRQHPEGQAKTYETLENAKKLKKMLVNSIYQNRDPLYNLIHTQQQSSNNNNFSKDNSQNSLNQLNQHSSSTLRVVKVSQQLNHQQPNSINQKQRSSSVQKEYSSGNKNESLPHYSHLNCIPNDSQNKSNSTSYRDIYNLANNACQEHKQLTEQEKQILSGKKQVTFSDPAIKKNQNANQQVFSPKHQCFHKEGCPKHQQNNLFENNQQELDEDCINLNLENKYGFVSQEKQILNYQSDKQDLENRNKLQKVRDILNDNQCFDKLGIHENQQQTEVVTIKKINANNSQSNNFSARNTPSPKERDQKSTQKQGRSFSASNSAKKHAYQNLIESEEEKQEILKKIQDQKELMKHENNQNDKGSNNQNKQQASIQRDTTFSSKKPPAPSNISHGQQQISKHSKQSVGLLQQNNTKQQEKDKKETIQKQRSVSSQQYSNVSTSKGNQFNTRSSSKGRSESQQKDKSIKKVDEQNVSFEGDNSKREQKIADLQNMIERIKVENTNRLTNLEIKKLHEQMEKDKFLEKQQLEIKQQQKTIYLLTQEKELLQEQSDQLENKYKQTQNKLKIFDKQRMELEDEIQRQILQVQELKNQINENKIQYNDLNKRYALLKKQNDELENEKNKINQQKIKIENEAQQKATQFQCMNKQNFDLTIEFERKNKESQYQINQLIEKVNDMTKKYEESAKNESIYEKKYKAEQQKNEQLRVELKLIQAQVSENEELKKKIKQKENKLDELESVVDDLKRKIRNNLDIDMKPHQNKQLIEKIIEKPVYIEKKVEIEKSTFNSNLAQEYKAQMIKCQQDISELKRALMQEQELHHQKAMECETWKNHAFQIEDKLRGELNLLKQSIDGERNILDKELREKDVYIQDLKSKISALLLEVETLTHKNIDKNRQIANEIINQNSVLQVNDTYQQIPNYFGSSQNMNNQSYISYIHG